MLLKLCLQRFFSFYFHNNFDFQLLSSMDNTVSSSQKSQESVASGTGKFRCPNPPCLFTSTTEGGLSQHISRIHTRATVVAGSFVAVAVPDFSWSLAVLRCLNCQEFCSEKRVFNRHIHKMRCPWCKCMWKF
jgi:hypothetical protein